MSTGAMRMLIGEGPGGPVGFLKNGWSDFKKNLWISSLLWLILLIIWAAASLAMYYFVPIAPRSTISRSLPSR